MTPTWNTPEDLHRLLDEWRAAKQHHGNDRGVTWWAYQRWPQWAWKWQRPKWLR